MTDTVLVADRRLPVDEARGASGMLLFILTEALLFVVLFFAYFYLAHDAAHWPPAPPKLELALIMLAVLLTSSGVLFVGERVERTGRQAAARLAVAATMLLGIAFLVLQGMEYRERLREVSPVNDAYGSIFFTLTGVHGAHVALGLCMLGFVSLLPAHAWRHGPPYRPLHNAALYWHFVDAVWVVIVALLYVMPHVRPSP